MTTALKKDGVAAASCVRICESARGPDADRHVKLLSQFAVEGSLSGAYSQYWA